MTTLTSVTRKEFDDLRRSFHDLRDGLLGTEDFPGGKLGAIAVTLEEMPKKIIATLDERRRISRRALFWDVTKIVIGLIGGVGAVWVTWKQGHG